MEVGEAWDGDMSVVGHLADGGEKFLLNYALAELNRSTLEVGDNEKFEWPLVCRVADELNSVI